jgi:glucan endo-1,3-alpha-glucosidase
LTLASDIFVASSQGLDGFALNVGRDFWQKNRVADAYEAAYRSGINFKLFMSFDMASLPCASAGDADVLKDYISTYAYHQNSMRYNGNMLVSTFAGENCRFEMPSLDQGWTYAVKSGPQIHFVPSFFIEPFGLKDVMDGAFNVSCQYYPHDSRC